MIRTESLVKTFSGYGGNIVKAVQDVSITVESGSFTVLRGKSGSGKTTLINLIGALDRPSSGRVWLGDNEITAISEAQRERIRRRQIGFVFQSVALFGNMTALENVEFGMRIAGAERNTRHRRAEECLDLVGLSGRKQHIPQELSGGEQQRVAIARAVAHKPVILLADEPTSQLDTKTSLQIIKIFIDLIENEKITLVMTSHAPEIADVAHKIYTLKDGKLTDES